MDTENTNEGAAIPPTKNTESDSREQFINWFQENKKAFIDEIKKDILDQISPLLHKLEEIIQQQPVSRQTSFIADGPFKKLQQDSKEKLYAMEKQGEVMEKQAEQIMAMEEQVMIKIEKAERRFTEMQTRINKRIIK